MIKQLWVVMCDICGDIAKCKQGSNPHGIESHIAPPGWWQPGAAIGSGAHLCPKCAKKIGGNAPQSSEEFNDWIPVEVSLPKKNGRYQVVILSGNNQYHVTMRKFRADKECWFTGMPTPTWERNTCGVKYWKPMSDLPEGLTPLNYDPAIYEWRK